MPRARRAPCNRRSVAHLRVWQHFPSTTPCTAGTRRPCTSREAVVSSCSRYVAELVQYLSWVGTCPEFASEPAIPSPDLDEIKVWTGFRRNLLEPDQVQQGPNLPKPDGGGYRQECTRGNDRKGHQPAPSMGCGSSRAHGAAGPGACFRSRPSQPVVHLTQSSRFSLTRAILASLEQERLARKAARKTSPQSKRLRRVSFSDDVKEPLEHNLGGEKEGQSQPAASSGRKV